jgi:DNA-binding transcriptional MerR regulator
MNYSLDQAVCLTGCTRSQLRYWVETGLIFVPSGEPGSNDNGHGVFSFRNLVELRAVRGMLDNGVSLQKVRRTIDYLQHNLGHVSPLAECRLITDGSSIFKICADSGEVIDTLRRGQFAFAIALGDMAAEIEALCSELKHDKKEFIDQLLAEEEEPAPEFAGIG